MSIEFPCPCTRCGLDCSPQEAVCLVVVIGGLKKGWGWYHSACASLDHARGWYPCTGPRGITFQFCRLPELPRRGRPPGPHERPCHSFEYVWPGLIGGDACSLLPAALDSCGGPGP